MIVRFVLGKGYVDWAKILSMGDVPDVAALLDSTYMSNRIDLIAQDVVKPWQGRFHPFVPFDPVREVCFRRGLPTPDKPYGLPETCNSMAMVRRAIEEQGYIGVTLYHSLG